MAVGQTHIGSTKVVMGFPMAATNLGNNNGTLNLPGETGITGYAAPANGWIIGYSGTLNAALTTGTVTVHATIDGSLCPGFNAADASYMHTGHESGYQIHDARQRLYYFTAGQRIGGEYRASDTLNPTSTDGAFMIITLLEDIRY